MKKVELTKAYYAIVDDDDYDVVCKYKWHTRSCGGNHYAGTTFGKRNVSQKTLLMHRVVLNAKEGQIVDHINGDGLDNRKSNLRFVTRQQNAWNSKVNYDKHPKGITWNKNKKKWQAQIRTNQKTKYLGLYADPQEAVMVYKKFARKLHKEFFRDYKYEKPLTPQDN